MKIVALVPLHGLAALEQKRITNASLGFLSQIYFVVSKAAPLPVLSSVNVSTSRVKNVVTLTVPSIVGKAQAMRFGLSEILKDKSVTHVLQTDGRGKISLDELQKFSEAARNQSDYRIVGDRYCAQEIGDQLHRSSGLALFSEIYQEFLGLNLADGVCGTRIY